MNKCLKIIDNILHFWKNDVFLKATTNNSYVIYKTGDNVDKIEEAEGSTS